MGAGEQSGPSAPGSLRFEQPQRRQASPTAIAAPVVLTREPDQLSNMTWLPKLVIPEGLPSWKRGIILGDWMSQSLTVCGSISVQFKDYVKDCLTAAKSRFEFNQCKARNEHQKFHALREIDRRFDGKLVLLLQASVPERVTSLAGRELGIVMGDVAAGNILDILHQQLMPGGQDEMHNLLAFVRHPGRPSQNNGAALRDLIGEWQLARQRIQQLGIADIASAENDGNAGDVGWDSTE